MKIVIIFIVLFLTSYCYSQQDLDQNRLISIKNSSWISYDDNGIIEYSNNQSFEEAELSWCRSYPYKCRERYEAMILRIKLQCYPVYKIANKFKNHIIHHVGIRH